jgi:lysophospholipase L1-like esterase|tara:strand:- start:526 stop:960 length:435 start_codon:yes stop_codon:yes gene_type:complete
MLAELAAANAAFGIIRQAVQNTGDLARAGSAIAKFVGAKEDLEKKVAGKNKSSVGGSDLQAFLALEQVKESEYELKKIMIYIGRPGLWNDWQRFQAEARKQRREQEQKTRARRQMIIEVSVIAAAIIVGLGAIAIAAYFLKGLR